MAMAGARFRGAAANRRERRGEQGGGAGAHSGFEGVVSRLGDASEAANHAMAAVGAEVETASMATSQGLRRSVARWRGVEEYRGGRGHE